MGFDANQTARTIADAFAGAVGEQLRHVSRDSSVLIGGVRKQVEELKALSVHIERQNRRESGAPIDLAAIISKAIVCLLKGHATKDPGSQFATGAEKKIALELYPGEPLVARALNDLPGVVARAASAPASTTDAAWAGIWSQTRNADLIPAIAPQSLYAQLSPLGLRLSFEGVNSLRLPTRLSTLAGDFVGESAPIPVRQMSLSANIIGPVKKMAAITGFSVELAERSVPSIEAVVRQAMADDTGTLLDTRMIDTGAATAVRPAGLLNGVTPITPTAGGGVTALAGDLGALAAAIVAPIDLVYLMNPADRIRALVLAPGLLGVTILESAAITPKMVIALDASDLVTAEGDRPSFLLSENAVLHVDDAPLAIGTPGSPATVAAPTVSLWQEDLVAIRLILFCTWGMRRSGRVAAVSAVTW